MITLKQSMEMGGKCHLNWLNPEFNYLPSNCWGRCHDTGRWWDAMLRLEAATGFVIPAEIEGAMLQNLEMLTGNPDGLLMVCREVAAKFPGLQKDFTEEEMRNRNLAGLLTTKMKPSTPDKVMHNLREGMLAFNALVRYRNNKWASVAGHKLLRTIDKILRQDGTLDIKKIECWNDVPEMEPRDGTGSCGRALEAIVWFHEATGDSLALEVADRIARHHLNHTVNSDGSMREEIVAEANSGHTHSYLGTLRGLLLFGLLTKQHEYVEAVAATFRNALPANVITESGWTAHDLGKHRFTDQTGNRTPESAGCGDAVQIALWLALNAGYTEFLDDVERWVRSRLLPAQCTETDRPALIKEIMRGNNIDEEAAKATTSYRLSLGGWTVHGWPHGGKGVMPDVCSAVVHTLTDVYNNITTRTKTGLTVNLHFDYDDSIVGITSQRGERARLTVRPKVRGNILIRIPGWAKKESVSLKINGEESMPKFIGDFACISQKDLCDGSEIIIGHALPKRETTEVTEKGPNYKFAWRGDEIIGISPNCPMPFYKTL